MIIKDEASFGRMHGGTSGLMKVIRERTSSNHHTVICQANQPPRLDVVQSFCS